MNHQWVTHFAMNGICHIWIKIALMLVIASLVESLNLQRKKRSEGIENLQPRYIMGQQASATTKATTLKPKTTKDDIPAPSLPLVPWWARVLLWSLLWIIIILLVCCLYTLFVCCCVPTNPAPGEIQEFRRQKERETGKPVDVYWNAKTRKLMWAPKWFNDENWPKNYNKIYSPTSFSVPSFLVLEIGGALILNNYLLSTMLTSAMDRKE